MSVLALGATMLQSPTVDTASGLHTTTFDTLHGTVVVNLPDDVRAGDTISGTVLVEPRGKDDAERAKNASTLNGFVVEAAGRKASSGGFKWLLPAATATMPLVLKDARGRPVGRPATIPFDSTNVRPPQVFQAPPFAQRGLPLVCPGPFDGDFQSTTATVGGVPATNLAESPRQLVVQPLCAPGPGEVQIKEGDKSFSAPIQTLAIRLSAPKQTLLPNESTEVRCEVSGFDGAPDTLFPVPFELQCLTPATARLRGIPGNSVAHSIQKEDVVGGIYSYNVGLTGLQAGAFSVRAGVLWSWPWSKKPKPNPLLAKRPCPANSPFAICCWLITVEPGEGLTDVDHSAVSIDGKVYSFEGGGMVVYPNTGAYLNKRKFEDGRKVWVNPVSGVDKDAMRKKAQEVIDAKKPYDLFGNNCALNAAGLLKAGGVKDILEEVKPMRLQKRNEDLGTIGKREEITKKQIE